MQHHAFLVPGFFGFGKLGSYSYFAHVERALQERFAAAGHALATHVIEELPTASIRRRATRLAEVVARCTAGSDAPIHLVGHSTGGLDARLVASPDTATIDRPWLPRLASVTTINTPHFGTPLASFFATANGQHVLAALAVLTAAGLSLGKQPLAIASVLLGFLTSSDALPFRVRLLDRAVKQVVGIVDDVRSPELTTFLGGIEDDQGAVLQLSPEAMDLVTASFRAPLGVRCQSTVAMAPPPKPRRWLGTLGHPWRAVSLSVFYALHKLTANVAPRYPCRAAEPQPAAVEALLHAAYGRAPELHDNDGIVPLRSQLWGDVVWAGTADHLDVLGHFADARSPDGVPPDLLHRDWLTSGSHFGAAEFAGLLDAIVRGMLGR